MNAKFKILIVDDNRQTVAGLKSFLDGKYNTVIAHDGIEGIQAFENDIEGIDLVITDLVMPSSSGVTLIEVELNRCAEKYFSITSRSALI